MVVSNWLFILCLVYRVVVVVFDGQLKRNETILVGAMSMADKEAYS